MQTNTKTDTMSRLEMLLEDNEKTKKKILKEKHLKDLRMRKILFNLTGMMIGLFMSIFSLCFIGIYPGVILGFLTIIATPSVIRDIIKTKKKIPTTNFNMEIKTLDIDSDLIQEAIENTKANHLEHYAINDLRVYKIFKDLGLKLSLAHEYVLNAKKLRKKQNLQIDYSQEEIQAMDDIMEQDIKIKKRGRL